jgi:rod shape-determining protein MreD
MAFLLAPLVEHASAEWAIRPNLYLAPLAICLSLCPGAPAVIGCGLIGLFVDCVSGPQLGARAACFCLIAALASLAVRRRDESWSRRIVVWGITLFTAEIFSAIIASSSTGAPFHPRTAAFEAGRSALATTIFLSGLWLLGEILSRGPHAARSFRRLAPAIGRSWSGD